MTENFTRRNSLKTTALTGTAVGLSTLRPPEINPLRWGWSDAAVAAKAT